MLPESFDYHSAFSRNLGWVTETEQEILRSKRIAIAGLGGVGGSHLLTLTRLGIGNFNIADLDIFEQENFNRQAGASIRHVGREKADVLEELALDINPQLKFVKFSSGVDVDNLDQFLEGVDLYVDALDFFAVDIRQAVFAACAEKGIPAITAAPLGMGVAFLAFLPGQMTFEEYFRLAGQPEDEQLLRFLLGLSPAMLQVKYLIDDTRLDLNAHKGPSTAMACELCAGMAGTHALKILLNRGEVPAAPRGLHFDAYRNKMAKTWRPMGNDNPIQRLGLKLVRKRLSAKLAAPRQSPEQVLANPIERILDYARWAPSGDNTQPWQFELLSDEHLLIHTRDTRDWCVYDLAGRASQTSVGTLLENIAIAARSEGLDASFTLQDPTVDAEPVIDVRFSALTYSSDEASLLPYIKTRSVQRRPLSTRPLMAMHKHALEAAVGPGYRVIWIEGRQKKWQITRLLLRAAGIRLTIPEVYQVHKKIIHWGAQFSHDRIPDQALGADALTTKMMQWALQSWGRVKTMNRYFAGTLMPRIQLDLIPALRCATHFVIVADVARDATQDYLSGGRATQRFWLTATKLGLQLQPEMTPLIFATYAREGRRFTDSADKLGDADTVRVELDALTGGEVDAVFMGRLGFGASATSRSLRKTKAQLSTSEQ
ncbi:MAG: ThiF family adenylyltransferase [Gammaproteobacteria bacterium]|nr:ThiF family adenylyltransferase [Gammaproteobacteria bacterium]MBQ0838606.1 ThiF family adenylyltransferase [Gammaproteobacteria bacterium]